MDFAVKSDLFPPILVKICITLKYSVPYMKRKALLSFHQPLALLCRNSLTDYFLSKHGLQVIKIN